METDQVNWKNNVLLFEQGLSKNRDIRNRLIEENLKLVYFIVKRFKNKEIDKDDLIQIGTIGLIKAVATLIQLKILHLLLTLLDVL